MKLWGSACVVLLVVAVGCRGTEGDNPPEPPGGSGGGASSGGGGGGGSGSGSDSGVTPADAVLMGRVCEVSDPRLLTTCDDTIASGVMVAIGSATATPASSGDFSIIPPNGNNLSWKVTGSTITTTVMPFGTSFEIPSMTTAKYTPFLQANGIVEDAGQGAVMVRVLDAGKVLSKATVAASPIAAQYATIYDGQSMTLWEQGSGTGANGDAFLYGLADGTTTSIVVTPTGSSTPVTVDDVPIVGGAITFLTIETQ